MFFPFSSKVLDRLGFVLFIDSGEVVVQSGQMTQEEVGTLRWDGAVAQARLESRGDRDRSMIRIQNHGGVMHMLKSSKNSQTEIALNIQLLRNS